MKRYLLFSLIVLSVACGLYGQGLPNPEMPIITNEDELRGDRSPHVNGTFYTQYYGVRNGNISYFLWAPNDTCFHLLDTDAAVELFKMSQGSTTPPNDPNPFCNASAIWGNPPSPVYENYILDAYWAALQYVYYLRNHFNCPKDVFQRRWNANQMIYETCDTNTYMFIANDACVDNTHWKKYTSNGVLGIRDQSTPCCHHAIIIGSPGTDHAPRASIDDVVHEFAHIFSFQTWHTSSENTADDKLAEACADIWAAIITHEIYPNDESKIWKIGEDVVLPNSGNSCIRNLAVPNDPTAEMQMDTCICQESGGDAYQQSGIISHWFYLLTHGYSGKGCDGKCYAFNAIPIDSAAKLIYYCEMDYFYQGMTFSDIVQATIEAAEVFSNPSIIRQSICGAWNVMGASTCGFDEFEEFEVEQHYGLSFNAVNSGDYYVGSDIVIDSLQTLNLTGTIHMNDTCRLIVRPGGKLIVNGGTLTNACDGEMWEGIIVEGNPSLPQYAQRQGSVILNNATVENARNAISTRGADTNAVYEHTGGIIQATNTLFRNNRRTAEFLEYENHYGSNVTDNVSHFIRCSFTVDDDNLFASNGTSFLEHVSLWKVRGVKFNGCTFRNETTGSSTRGAGILSIEAGFTAKRVCPQLSNSDPCGCYNSGSDTVRRCSFTGFSEAVHAANTLGAYDITLDNCDFAYNTAGVSLYAADNARVSFCDFALGDSLSVLGLLLSRSSGFTVEGNTFHKHSQHYPYPTGILCDSTGTAENIIRLNSFSGLYTACNAVGNNSAIPMVGLSGLQYQCNSYNGNTYDIFVSSSSRIRSYQGSSTQGADNSFARTLTSSLSIPSGTLRYYHSAGSGHAPIGATSNVTVLNATANACGSTLCGVQGGGSGLGPKGAPALAQYRALGEEYAALLAAARGAYLQMDDTLTVRLSDLSSQMGDLARTEIRNILCDSVPDMELLKEWYGVVIAAAPATGDIPVSAYQLAEVYSQEGGLSTAAALLAALPQQFIPDEAARSEYSNYMALQQLRETVSGNWYLMTDTDIEAMQRVAEHDNGRAARMAKEILCFFHHICYGDDMVLNLGDIGERALLGGRTRCVPTADGLVIYPNPTGSTLTVESASPIREITVYDLSGRVMATMVGNGTARHTVNVSSLHSGIYILKALTDSGVETGRFVKN